MDSGLDAADVLSLAKLSWDLYRTCYLVAGDAPDGFRQLVNELASLQGVLRTLRDDVNSNASFFDELENGRQQILARCLGSCCDTLNRLNELISRYQALGIGDRKQLFWQKIKWATQRTHIEELKSKIMVHSCNINLCMSSIGNASLERLEQSMMDALDKEYVSSAYESPQLREEESPILPLSIKSNRAVEREDGSDNGDPPRGIYGKPTHRPTMSANWPRHVSTSSESMVSGQSDGSIYGGSPGSPMPSMTKRPISPSVMSQPAPSTVRSEYMFDGRASAFRQMEDHAAFQKDSPETPEMPLRDANNGEVTDAVSTARHQLQQTRLKEQSLRPLRFEPQDKLHKPDAELNKHFENSAFDELRVRRLNTRDWLLVAVWWLLKARTTLDNSEKPGFADARGSLSPSTDSRSTSHQAYVDLMKSSYILYDIVLIDENSRANLTDENRKLIADLSEGIKEEFSQFTSVDVPENMSLYSQNINIWEALQPEENLESSNDGFAGQKSARWITVEQEDAGDEEERVLFRTFVNAGIGAKKFRMRTKGAPYMLLLSTRYGESEPKVTICNQSGTLCLQRDFVPDDLTQLMRISNATLSGVPGVKISEPVSLMFDHMGVSISFQYESDLVHFINIPKAYFNAVWQRQPVDSDLFSESVIFKSSVEIVEQMKASTMKSMNPPLIHRSCEVRILERSFGEAWRTVRRMVISTSAAEKMPRCIEFFMPMSRVQVSRDDDTRQVLVKWSDTCQERSKTDGNYNPLYSYIYDDNSPNIGLGFHFRTQQGAEDFERAALTLSIPPSFSWAQGNSSGHVYDVADTGAEQKQYKAVQLYRNRLTWKYCDVGYMYRDVDYEYNHSNLRVRLPRVNFTDYISSHVDQLYGADSPVAFSHCDRKAGDMQADFGDEAVLRRFMSSLTSYELLFSRRAYSLIAKPKSLFGAAKKSKKGDTEVQIWRQGNSVQMAARWSDDVPDRWLTMSVMSGRVDPSKDSNQAGFSNVEYSRGTVIDLANIVSRSPKSANMARREGTITITFKCVRDREEFVAALEGRW